MADSTRRRILIVEDHEVVSEGLRALLTPHFDIVGQIRDGLEVIAAVHQTHPDAILLDLSIPGRGGMDLLPELHQTFPGLAVVVLTGGADFIVGRTALALGARGFLPKDSGADEVELALRTAISGRQYFSPRVPAPPRPVTDNDLPPTFAELTPRQLTLLTHIGSGLDSNATAVAMGLSLHTVHFHRRNLRRVLGVESEDGLVRIAAIHMLKEDLKKRQGQV
jgi:two-component system nitrate/nitrite response regulator NarL